ncbi:DNA cytosine methyltransferase [Leptospira licerasiae]|uniref:DNA cytosine methyltransferase n=1 Tax=Leptospira licerasiae TaxID=447106 RepID=UPI0010828E4D|nr:DNA cytosine methyltransferase [Leptospira licerasiae]TGM87906.1 DNA cytosine methyltransferase [Leptospira licerasiae]
MELVNISLFSGALGLDLGLEKAGIKLASVVDMDPDVIATIETNYKRKKVKPIILQRKLTLKNIKGTIKEIIDNIDLKYEKVILSGAPPCQPFTTVGKRKSFEDERSEGFLVFLKAIRLLKPDYFIIENVPGLLSVKPMEGKSENFFQIVMNECNRIGKTLNYNIDWKILDSVNFGGPQKRKRLFIIGSRDNIIPWPKKTHDIEGGKKAVNIRTVFKGIENHDHHSFGSEVISVLKLIPQGGDWRDLPVKVSKIHMKKAFFAKGGRTGFFRRLDYNKPSPTILGSPTAKATMLCHPVKNRPLSVQEYSAIQGFPKNWKFSGSIGKKYTIIGNATPIHLSYALGKEIKKQLSNA